MRSATLFSGLGTIAALCLAISLVFAGTALADEDPAAAMYSPGTVDVVDLTMPQTSIEALEADPEGEYVPGTFSLATTDGTPAGVGSFSTPINVGIRLKGGLGSFQTLSGKAGFKIKLNYVKGTKFLGLKKMTLNNMVQDPSMVHETLDYRLFHTVGVQASRTGYAYVRLNGLDYGLYLNIETLDDTALEKRFGEFDDPQHLYEGSYGPDVVPGVEVAPDEIGKFEVDEGDDEHFEDLEALIAAVNDETAPDFSEAVEPVADLLEMTRNWAVEKYIGHWDGYAGMQGVYWPNNYYLYSDPNGVFQMLPWGVDQTWSVALPFDGAAGVMFDKCLADQSCASLYRRALREVKAGVDADDLDNLADSTAALLEPWQEMDPRRPYGMQAISDAVAATRAFIAGRPQQLAEWLATQPEELETSEVALSFEPPTMIADGKSTSTVTATATDDEGNPVSGEDLAFSSSDPDQQIGAVTDNGDGTYSATITASTTVGKATITASDLSVDPVFSGQGTLEQIAGPPAHLSLSLSPSTMVADGHSTSLATVEVTDAGGHPAAIPPPPVPCGCSPVTLTSSDGGDQIGPVTEGEDDSTFLVPITASTKAGTATVSASYERLGTQLATTAPLTQHAGPAATLSLSLSPPILPADGTSSTSALVTVSDSHGNPIGGDHVTFTSSDGGQRMGETASPAIGAYAATITASRQQGSSTITATDTSTSAPLVAQVGLVQSVVGEVHLGPIRRRIQNGTADLTVVPPGEGSVTMSGGGLVGREASVSSTPIKLTVAARGRKARALKRAGKVKVGGEVEFTPEYGTSSSASFALTLIRKRQGFRRLLALRAGILDRGGGVLRFVGEAALALRDPLQLLGVLLEAVDAAAIVDHLLRFVGELLEVHLLSPLSR